VAEDLRRDVKPLPLKKKQHVGDVPPTIPGGPGGGTPPTPTTDTVTIDSTALLALSTQPKLLVAVPAGNSLEFQGATAAYTFSTLSYVGTGNLQVKCGATVGSNDVPVAFLTAATSGSATFTALPGITLVPDLPLTLTGPALTGGDGTLVLNVTSAAHPPDAGALEAKSGTAAQSSAHAVAVKPPIAKKPNHK
jgi:hypothetical protein